MMKSKDNFHDGQPGVLPSVLSDPAQNAVPVVDTASLFCGRREVALRLGDAIYHLKITRLGKLILNK